VRNSMPSANLKNRLSVIATPGQRMSMNISADSLRSKMADGETVIKEEVQPADEVFQACKPEEESKGKAVGQSIEESEGWRMSE